MNILDQDTLISLFNSHYLFFSLSIMVGAFILNYLLIPKVLWVSQEKKLTKPVIGRSAHNRETPTLGGVAFFISFVLIISVIQSVSPGSTGNHLVAALTILFMVGLKDDLVVSTAKVKLVGQLLAASFLVFSPELQLTNLYGFLGISEVPAVLGYLLNAFLVVAFINAYNLIDGINGLAGVVGIVAFLAFGTIFYFSGYPFFVLICGTAIGILLAFLRFNFSRGEKKIFMGDSGSLIIGLVLGFLSLKLLSMKPDAGLLAEGYSPANRLLLVLSILFVPIFDTARVMLLRILKGRSPFSADRNHAHHVLLDLGFNHVRASMILGGINLLVILLYILVNRAMSTPFLTLFIFGTYVLFFCLFQWGRKIQPEKVQETSPQPPIEGVKVKRSSYSPPIRKSIPKEPKGERVY